MSDLTLSWNIYEDENQPTQTFFLYSTLKYIGKELNILFTKVQNYYKWQ